MSANRGKGGYLGASRSIVRQAAANTQVTSSSNFTTSANTETVNVMVVAGGGGGGINHAGGGGGGGQRYIANVPVSGSTAYPIVVGAGGAAAPKSG